MELFDFDEKSSDDEKKSRNSNKSAKLKLK